MRKLRKSLSLILALLMVMSSVTVFLPIAVSGTEFEDSKIFDLGLNFGGAYGTVAMAHQQYSSSSDSIYNEMYDETNQSGVMLYKWNGVSAKDSANGLEYYDVSDGRLTVNDFSSDDVANGITVEMYVKLDSLAENTEYNLVNDRYTNYNLLRYGETLYIGSPDGTDFEKTASLIPTDEWMHVVMTQKSGDKKVYLNGEEIASTTDCVYTLDPTVQLSFGGLGVYFNDVKIYTSAASADDVTAMYETYSAVVNGDYTATPEEREAVEAVVEGNELPIGGWSTPYEPSDTERQFGLLKDAGINFMVTMNEIYREAYMDSTLKAAEATDMDIYLDLMGPPYYDQSTMLQKLNLFADRPNVKGVYLWDEPVAELFDLAASSLNGLKDDMYADLDLDWGLNLAPMQAYDIYQQQGYLAYKNEVRGLLENADMDYLCYDYYPFGNNKTDSMYGYLEALVVNKQAADEYDTDLWSFIQCSKWNDGTMRAPNVSELSYLMNITFAMGVKKTLYYITCDTSDSYVALIDREGNLTSEYDVVKTVDKRLEGTKGLFLDYENEGLVVVNKNKIKEHVNSVSNDVVLDSYKELQSVETDTSALVGCMTNPETNQTGLYVVNPQYTVTGGTDVVNIITLNLDESTEYQVWGADGLEQMGKGGKITMDVDPGDGKFVILDSVNDPSEYPDPQPPVPVDVSVAPIDAVAHSKVFDLGFNDDGTIYNAVDGGVTLREKALTGTVVTEDGIKALTDYQIITNRVNGMETAEGATVEMYIKLKQNVDGTWFIFFRNPYNNHNLYRITTDKYSYPDKSQVWFGLCGGVDIQYNTTDANGLFPSGEWLHIVSSQSGNAKSCLYVNGEKIFAKKYMYAVDKALEQVMQFVDQDAAAYLAQARVYNYQVTDEEALQMYRDCVGTQEDSTEAFTDLNREGWYMNSIRSVVSEGLFGGITETEFAPDMNMTRSMFVTVLARLNGVDLDAYTPAGENPFTDVTSNQWFYKAVMWASENEIVNGMTADTFGPDGNITREQMCTMIIRYTTKFDIAIKDDVAEVIFDDAASIASWAADAVKACQKAGLVTGMTPTTFVPGANASRAQVAAIFTRLMTQ